MERSRAKELMRKFKDIKLLVIGDVMLDEFLYGESERLSPEAPVPVIKWSRTKRMLGGAGNVATNIALIGGNVNVVGVVGDDADGNTVYQLGEYWDFLVDPSRKTTRKTRVLANHQHVCRIDNEDVKDIPENLEDSIVSIVKHEPVDGIILIDYGKGMFGGSLLYKIQELNLPTPVFVDPKGTSWRRFPYSEIIVPNRAEAEKMSGVCLAEDFQYAEAARVLFQKHRPKVIMIKRGSEGISTFEEKHSPVHVRATAQQVFDVSGAGDTVIAVASLARLAGATLEEMTTLANTAAGIVVSKLGTSAVSQEEVLNALGE